MAGTPEGAIGRRVSDAVLLALFRRFLPRDVISRRKAEFGALVRFWLVRELK